MLQSSLSSTDLKAGSYPRGWDDIKILFSVLPGSQQDKYLKASVESSNMDIIDELDKRQF